MAQSFRQLVYEVAGPVPKPEVYYFTERTFKENRIHGAYDGDNDAGNLTTEAGKFLQTEYSDFIIIQGY